MWPPDGLRRGRQLWPRLVPWPVIILLWLLTWLPATAGQVEPQPTPTPQADGRVIYSVVEGDSLIFISLRFDVPLELIYELNDLTAESVIVIGQPILLGYAAPGVGGNALTGFPGALVRPDGTIVHRVVPGDTLISIALRYNLTLDELYAASGLGEETILRLGQEVVLGRLPEPEEVGGSADVPGGTATPTPTPTPPASPTSAATATLIVLATAAVPTPLPIADLALTASPFPLSPVGLPDTASVISIFWGVVVLLALTGALFLYIGRRR